ncbi:hypothetical protein Bca52824_032843 [Brassica carinata]|uniref:Uncharacterized protein n=1 Tax=Brassica carinata TaxID=52824 RepID=A0A8X7SD92_BRACI|nr:hypothetical protein Bca52824_032843 [Brassica carinata]
MSLHVRSSVSGIDCKGWSDGAGSVCSQAEESAFRAVKGIPLSLGELVARGGGLESRRRSGEICSTCDLRALEIHLLEGFCSSCCRRVSEHVVILREVLLRSGVGGVVHGVSKAMLRPSSQSSSLFPVSTSEHVDLLLLGLTPPCVCCFILATGCCFRRQELTSTRFSEEATFEGLGCLCLSAESPLLRSWSVFGFV